jgi:hemerythrin-like domain-containing protein
MAPRSKKRKELDAVAMLTEDHKQVRELFRAFAGAERRDFQAGRAIVALTCTELKVHTSLEREIFYPAARSKLNNHDAALIDAAEVEHRAVDALIARLERLSPDDPAYAATFTVLAAYVDHHITAEQNRVFPAVKRARLDLGAVAADLRKRKQELMGAVDTPGQTEPSLQAEGSEEPTAAEALARQARKGASR